MIPALYPPAPSPGNHVAASRHRGHQQLVSSPPRPGHPDSWLRDKADVRAELTASFSHWIFQKRETTARLLLNNLGAGVGEDALLNDFLNSEAINRTGSSPPDPLSLKLASTKVGPGLPPPHLSPRDKLTGTTPALPQRGCRGGSQALSPVYPSVFVGTEERF